MSLKRTYEAKIFAEWLSLIITITSLHKSDGFLHYSIKQG